MKDLYLHVADAEMSQFLKSILTKTQALGTRSFSYEIERNINRDSGVIKTGSFDARTKKRDFSKCVLICDHEGCGLENNKTSDEIALHIQESLALVTWQGNNAAFVIKPELEAWLWATPKALHKFFKTDEITFNGHVKNNAKQAKIPVNDYILTQPKKLLLEICQKYNHAVLRPNDFGDLGTLASISALQSSPSFKALNDQLKVWFS